MGALPSGLTFALVIAMYPWRFDEFEERLDGGSRGLAPKKLVSPGNACRVISSPSCQITCCGSTPDGAVGPGSGSALVIFRNPYASQLNRVRKIFASPNRMSVIPVGQQQ